MKQAEIRAALQAAGFTRVQHWDAKILRRLQQVVRRKRLTYLGERRIPG